MLDSANKVYRSNHGKLILNLLFSLNFFFVSYFAQAQNSSLDNYKRAQYFLNPNESKIYEAYVEPHWIEDYDLFWYKKQGIQKTEYFLIDPSLRSKKYLFNLDTLVISMGNYLVDSIDAKSLLLENMVYDHEKGMIRFSYLKQHFEYEIKTKALDSIALMPLVPLASESLSPNGKWVAYVKDHNLFVREVKTNFEKRLTFDGIKDFAYGEDTESNLSYVTNIRKSLDTQPLLLWSLDSKRIVTHHLDEREVKETYLIQMVDTHNSLRPKLFSYKYPVPGDSIVPMASLVVFNVYDGAKIKLNVPDFYSSAATPLDKRIKRVWWSDSTNIEVLWEDRYKNSLEYFVCNAKTGASEIMIKEEGSSVVSSNLNIFSSPNVKLLKSGEFVWFSERSGFAHLYLYGKDKKLKNAITSGEYVVRDIVLIDESNRKIYFTATGREQNHDPYFIHFYKANLDGTKIQLLTPDNSNQRGKLSPSLKYMVVNENWNGFPKSIVRDIEGKKIMDLETSDFSSWTNLGWSLPFRFKVLAEDRKTPLYGVMFKPSQNSHSTLPLLDDVYPGPQVNRAFHISAIDGPIFGLLRHEIATAELGFVVVEIDGRGTPFRSKEFLNYSYNNLGVAGGMYDHVSAIRQLAKQHAFVDTTKIGTYGHSGGGYASTRLLLTFPYFYKVAVSSSGNHDSRGYSSIWMDSYMGMQKPNTYEDQSNFSLVNNLRGKLLLMTGDLDDNVHPTMTINLIDRLIKANKDFDFILLPNANHTSSSNPYFIRRRWDYFYENLLNKKPPPNFELRLR